MRVPENHIALSSGGVFNIDTFKWQNVEIMDIAQSLAMTARFRGHSREQYSVAQHCCHLHDYALMEGRGDEVALWALLHDAAETYIGDCPGFFKTGEHIDNEHYLLRLVSERFGLCWPIPDYVFEIDKAILNNEIAELFDIGAVPELDLVIEEWGWWNWRAAKVEFLRRFYARTNMNETFS